MKVPLSKKPYRMLLLCFLLLLFGLPAVSGLSQPNIQREVMEDGVVRWQRVAAADEKPWFFQQVEHLFDVILGPKEALPFGKSVAFLVGVSRYEYLRPQLPFVENDLKDLRTFLLEKGGFDTVYVAADKTATRELIEDYMVNRFRKSLGKKDRLLFYYTGHGADFGGSTGYIQFSQAKVEDFARHVLDIERCREWSRLIKVKHILFIYDCCASGMPFTARTGEGDAYQQLLLTLSGNGSRTVITAGTADEKTYEVRDQQSRGNGVFTRAFLNAMESGRADRGQDGFMTMSEIFAQTEIGVKRFAATHNKKLTPRRWELEEHRYRGTFVLVNPAAEDVALSNEVSTALKARPRGAVVAGYGMVRLISYLPGKVYIDGKEIDEIIERGDAKVYDLEAGSHTIEVKGVEETKSRHVTVLKGRMTSVTIRSRIGKAVSPKPEPTEKPAEPMTVSRFSFRSTPKDNFSVEEVKAMLKAKGFFDSDWNKTGKGIENQYEVQTIRGDKVVKDKATGLLWQQSGSDHYMSYSDARKWIDELNRKGFAGYHDWRLPTLEEAMSLMEPKKHDALYIDAVFDGKQDWIWTADKMSASVAWVVDFSLGYCHIPCGLRRLRSGGALRTIDY